MSPKDLITAQECDDYWANRGEAERREMEEDE